MKNEQHSHFNGRRTGEAPRRERRSGRGRQGLIFLIKLEGNDAEPLEDKLRSSETADFPFLLPQKLRTFFAFHKNKFTQLKSVKCL
jgi:hypothetical protein